MNGIMPSMISVLLIVVIGVTDGWMRIDGSLSPGFEMSLSTGSAPAQA
jgi:hypothetical protein